MNEFIRVSVSGEQEKTYPLDKEHLTFGREAGADIHVRDSAVSRKHCVLSRKDNRWQLEDLESSNGTFCRGKRVVTPVTVKSGEKFRIGSAKVEIVYGKTGTSLLRHPASFAVIGVTLGCVLIAGVWAYKNHQAKSRRFFAGGGGGSIGVARPTLPIDVASFVPSSGRNIIKMEVPTLPADPNVKLKKRTIKIKGRLNLQGTN